MKIVTDRSNVNEQIHRGALVAATLAGAWRRSPAPLALSAQELADVAPLLLETGAGALGWWVVRGSSLRESPAAEELHQAYRLHALQSAIHEGQVQQVVTMLRSAGVEPLLAKGWAMARLYPEPGLRPYGDVDICVRTGEYSAALRAINSAATKGFPVDLNRRFEDISDHLVEEQYRRSQLVNTDGVDVRILGPEDQLRLVCVHLLRHGAWRPLWLCDVGAMLENLDTGFDWEYFLQGSKRRSEWVLCVLALAHWLLGAGLDSVPVDGLADRVPSWVIEAFLRQFGAGHPVYEEGLLTSLRRRSGALQAVRRRWPSPITAGVLWGSPHSRLPMWPLQLGDFTLRAARFTARLGRSP